MAASDLTVLRSPAFPQVLRDANSTASQIARAIVHLNFNEPEKAVEVLLDALTEINFAREKENSNGNRTAAA